MKVETEALRDGCLVRSSRVDTFGECFSPTDWQEAFAAHPRLGVQPSARSREQAGRSRRRLPSPAEIARSTEYGASGTSSSPATGQPATALLAQLKERLGNTPEAELAVAAEEQRKITRLRLAKLLAEEGG